MSYGQINPSGLFARFLAMAAVIRPVPPMDVSANIFALKRLKTHWRNEYHPAT